MYLIADSGGTTCKWGLVQKNKITYYTTPSVYPFFNSEQEIYNTIFKYLIPQLNTPIKQINEIIFFGTGLTNVENRNKIKQVLSKLFKEVKNTEIYTDIEACCLLTDVPDAIVSIIGTGSNTALSEHGKMTFNRKGLGFILGDEGSGAYLGKLFIQAYLYNEMNELTRNEFEQKFNLNYDKIMQAIYVDKSPNLFLANIVPYILENKKNCEFEKLITQSFNDYFERHILTIKNSQHYPIYFFGSLANLCKKELQITADKFQIKEIRFIENTIQQLSQKYQNKLFLCQN